MLMWCAAKIRLTSASTPLIFGGQAQVIRGFDRFGRQYRNVGNRIRLKRQMRHPVFRIAGHRSDHIDQIGNDRRCGRFGAGAGAVI